ncbi:uncharacterized protein LOC117173352 [Belonocnema kinseyi]|uniref:uncharacterized protein LOC117173352 n=1 Tax=Belonocnema kinseyi TaxID=2817044 RepID=UPI00143D90A8|nr:uncharacterized protein LOC117173352 [Belonocnema kinseyi]
MRVLLALQLISHSVAEGLRYYKSRIDELKDCGSTANFCDIFNFGFDALNRTTRETGIRLDSEDFKILQLLLDWLDAWEQRVLDGTLEKKDFLTESTAHGLRVTLHSTIELSHYLLEKCKFDYVLTGKINQDSLEVRLVTIQR